MYLGALKYMSIPYVSADAQLLGGMGSEEWDPGREIQRNFHFFGVIFSIFCSEHDLHVFLKSKHIYMYYRLYLHDLPSPSQM